MSDILIDVKKELTEKGYIQQNLLVWGRKKVTSLTGHPMFFFGVKDKKLLILPMKDFKTILFNESKYYTKEDIKNISIGSLTSILEITFHDGNTAKYSIFQGKSDMKTIISML